MALPFGARRAMMTTVRSKDAVHLTAERYDGLPQVPMIRHSLLHGGVTRLDPCQVGREAITILIRLEDAVVDIDLVGRSVVGRDERIEDRVP